MSIFCITHSFKCKGCGQECFIPYDILTNNSDKDIVIRIKCIATEETYDYTREDFKCKSEHYPIYRVGVIDPAYIEIQSKKQ